MSVLENRSDFEQRLFWLDHFLDASFQQIERQWGKPGTNNNLLTQKKFNLNLIKKFKYSALKEISTLKNKINEYENKNKQHQGAPIGDILNKSSMSDNQKESLRLDSINKAKTTQPKLF